jgi:hypothetical protein
MSKATQKSPSDKTLNETTKTKRQVKISQAK